MKERSKNLELFIHLLTAFILLLKGFEKITSHHAAAGIIIGLMGLAVLLITIFERRMRIQHFTARLICYLIECNALLMVAYLYYTDGKVYLPYVFLAAAIAYLIAAIIFIWKHSKQKK